MKKILTAAALVAGSVSAQAADLPAKAPYYKAPAVVARAYDWTGFYIGVNAGAGFGRDFSHLGSGGGDAQSQVGGVGGLGGGQIGYNWQFPSLFGFNNVVLGLEADAQGAGFQDNRTCEFLCNTTGFGFNQNLNWFATGRGRVGLATGPVLTYLTGGVAAGGVRTTITDLTAPAAAATFTNTRVGWTIGSGVEAALGGNWTAKLEYLYVDLGSQAGSNFTAPTPYNFTSEIHEQIFRVGLNYRIGADAGAVGLLMPEPAINWNGLYLGANAGGATALNPSSLTVTGVAAEKFNLSPNGYLGGGQIGYNWQSGHAVFGVEADAQGSSQRDNKACEAGCMTAGPMVGFDQKMGWLATARGRLGYAAGSTLFYVTGGFAYGGISNHETGIAGPTAFDQTNNHSKGGYALGGGVESPFNLFGWFGPNWTSKTEYLYVDLGRISDAVAAGATTITVSSHVQEHIFRTGLNYHLNQPVVAKY